jgi:hypothetical protein
MNEDMPLYLDTLDNQREKASRPKKFNVGDMVKVYRVSGVFRMRIKKIYDTPVEHVKLYELESADHVTYHATSDFMAKI